MHRRPLGRGRQLAALAAIVIVVGCILPWWQFGAEAGDLPARSGNAFEGSGILVFFAALATIALLALPYAAGERPVWIDRPLSFVALGIVAWIGLGIRVVQLATLPGSSAIGLPDRSPGLWLTGFGLILLSRAIYDIARERTIR